MAWLAAVGISLISAALPFWKGMATLSKFHRSLSIGLLSGSGAAAFVALAVWNIVICVKKPILQHSQTYHGEDHSKRYTRANFLPKEQLGSGEFFELIGNSLSYRSEGRVITVPIVNRSNEQPGPYIWRTTNGSYVTHDGWLIKCKNDRPRFDRLQIYFDSLANAG